MPEPESLHMEVGRLGGRLDAMENRMDRHERTTAETLSRMETKLDRIEDAVAQSAGGERMRKWITNLFFMIVGGVASVLGALNWVHH